MEHTESGGPRNTAPSGPVIALAGGGTGGHVVPGLHLIEGLLRRGTPPRQVLWFGAGRPIEERVFAGARGTLERVALERVALPLEPEGGGAPTPLRLARRLLPCTVQARAALLGAGADVVLGLGGYTSLPVVLAARSLGRPVGLLEINAVSGRATRWMAPLATRVFHAWSSTLPARPSPRHVHVGPPLSAAFAAGTPDAERSRAARAALGFAPQRPLLLILGGSQGAAGLNRFGREQAEALVAAGVGVLHQTGPGRLGEGAPGRSAPDGHGHRCVEYVEDVAQALCAATLVLSRGGASTLAEIAALARPAWIVPYPHHPDRHQERNAELLGEGVRIVPESQLGPALVPELVRTLGPEGEEERARRTRALECVRVPDASERLARELFALSRGGVPH